jgi:hypothetical protein
MLYTVMSLLLLLSEAGSSSSTGKRQCVTQGSAGVQCTCITIKNSFLHCFVLVVVVVAMAEY